MEIQVGKCYEDGARNVVRIIGDAEAAHDARYKFSAVALVGSGTFEPGQKHTYTEDGGFDANQPDGGFLRLVKEVPDPADVEMGAEDKVATPTVPGDGLTRHNFGDESPGKPADATTAETSEPATAAAGETTLAPGDEPEEEDDLPPSAEAAEMAEAFRDFSRCVGAFLEVPSDDFAVFTMMRNSDGKSVRVVGAYGHDETDGNVRIVANIPVELLGLLPS